MKAKHILPTLALASVALFWASRSDAGVFAPVTDWFDRAGAPDVGEASGAARDLSLPIKMALLSMKEPDAQLHVPVEGVRVRQITNTWGAERSGGRPHAGQDIFAKRGTAVYSATEGYVLRIGETPVGGKTVFVLGAGGRRYYYAHLDSHAPNLAEGDQVTPDTLLGYVGATGNAKGTPPHLHFGVYTFAGALDPLPLLADRISEGRSEG